MRRHLFLYLAIACLMALIAIFIADGYLGIHDIAYVTAGETEQKVEPDDWLWQDRSWTTGARWGEKVFFRYEIDNRRFSTYSTLIQASVWKENEKVFDLFSEDEIVKPFDKVTVEWILSGQELEEAGFGADRYTVKISRGEVERRVIVEFYSSEELPFPKPAPPR